jgi:hypothetical protein
MNLEKSVDHGEHSEHSGITIDCDAFWIHPLRWRKMLKNSGVSLCSPSHGDWLRGMSPWFELRF